MSIQRSYPASHHASPPAIHDAQVPVCAVEIAEHAGALERAGEWRAAAREYSLLFRVALANRDILLMVDALRGEGRTCRQRERAEEAEELFELSREIAERNGLVQAAGRAVNSLAALRFFQRDWEAARSLYESALVAARDIGDDSLVAWTCQNLGIIANVTGDLREARLCYLESIAASVRSGDESTAAIIYNNLGMVCCYLDEWLEALLYFDRGIEIAQRLGHTELLGKLHSNRAAPLIGLGDLNRAHRALNSAESFASAVADSDTLADIARFRGMAAVQAGDFAAAERHFARSLELVRDANLLLEHGQLLEEIAKFRWAQGRGEEALAALGDAHQKFVALGARWNVARAEALLAAWQVAEKNPLAAE